MKRRGLLYTAWKIAENVVYFLAPMVLADKVAQGFLKPLLMDAEDMRGPWECMWHKVSTVKSGGCLRLPNEHNCYIGHHLL